jgi:hypothetical protein
MRKQIGAVFLRSIGTSLILFLCFSCSNSSRPHGDKYKLTVMVTPDDGGATNPVVGEHEYIRDTQVDITATSAQGFVFSNWLGASNATTGTISLNMDSDKIVTAVFVAAATTYELTTAVSPAAAEAAGAHVDPAGDTYPEGTVVQLCAVTGAGWVFDHWEGDLSGNANPDDVTMNSDKMVTAHFSESLNNRAPYSPYAPRPKPDTTGVATKGLVLTWQVFGAEAHIQNDPDGDDVVYDIYFGKDVLPGQVTYRTGVNEKFYSLPDLDTNATYHWMIVARDQWGAEQPGYDHWVFSTADVDNTAPFMPSNPFPANDACDVHEGAIAFTWEGGDPDPGDTVLYRICIWEEDGDVVDCEPGSMAFEGGLEGLENPTYRPSWDFYSDEGVYSWQVEARDNHGAISYSPLWIFTVGCHCSINVIPNEAVTDDCRVDMLLNDELTSSPYCEDETIELVPVSAPGWIFMAWEGFDAGAIQEVGGRYYLKMEDPGFGCDRSFDAKFARAADGDSFAEDFEGPDAEWDHLSSGNPWVIGRNHSDSVFPILQGDDIHGGAQAAQFGTPGFMRSSWFMINLANVSAGKVVRFWYKHSPGHSSYYLKVLVNSEERFSTNAETAGWQQEKVLLDTGANEVEFRIEGGNYSENFSRIDDIAVGN